MLAGGRLVADGTPAEVLVPELITRHWGVDADTAVDDHGGVNVTVRRRRTVSSTPNRPATSPTDLSESMAEEQL